MKFVHPRRVALVCLGAAAAVWVVLGLLGAPAWACFLVAAAAVYKIATWASL